jgi:hypothetical protein
MTFPRFVFHDKMNNRLLSWHYEKKGQMYTQSSIP